MRYEESQIAKGVLFISSMKSQENIELLIIQMKVQCAKHNIFVEDVAVEHNLTGDLDIDRLGIKAVASAIAKKKFDVLVLRNQYDVTGDDSDWKKFLNDMEDMDIQVYLTDLDGFACSADEE